MCGGEGGWRRGETHIQGCKQLVVYFQNDTIYNLVFISEVDKIGGCSHNLCMLGKVPYEGVYIEFVHSLEKCEGVYPQ